MNPLRLIRGWALALACLILPAAPVAAHQFPLSYLTVERGPAGVTGELKLPVADLDLAVDLDANLDGALSWGEILARLPVVRTYVDNRVDVLAGGRCDMRVETPGIAREAGEVLLALSLKLDCPDPSADLTVQAAVFADIDPSSRTLLRLQDGQATTTQVLSPAPGLVAPGLLAARPGAQPLVEQTLKPSAGNSVISYFQEGLAHLFGGPDHMLFLLLLIAPGVLAATRFRDLWMAILLPVSGFTVGHALTLTAAASNLIQAPPRLVEILIAVTILLTAIDNVKRFLPGPRTLVATIFGLVHGLGFAGALGSLDLEGWPLAGALLGFNLGIEAGQVLIALAVAPLLFVVRDTARRYQLLPLGLSLAAGVMAMVWIAERTGLVA
jgi:hypothetical protein